MIDNPKTKLYGLVGYPLGHSLSPAMHNAVFKKLGIDARYDLYEIKPEEFDAKIQELLSNENIGGFNVTVPYKEKILQSIKDGERSDNVKNIGASNTVLKIVGGGIKFFNTDCEGFLIDLLKNNFKLYGKKVALIGAGGAGKSVFAAAALASANSIRVYDMDIKKSKDLVASWKNDVSGTFEAADNIKALKIEEADILINATPIGMKDGDPLLIDPKLLYEGLFVYDVIYNRQTELIKAAKEKGLEAHNGLWMLILQGYRALEIWFGREISDRKKEVLDTMENALKEKGFIAC